MALFNKSNFSSWAVHNKPCKPGAEDRLNTERSGCNAPIKPRRSSRAGASFDLTKQTKQSYQTKQMCQAGFRPGWAHGAREVLPFVH